VAKPKLLEITLAEIADPHAPARSAEGFGDLEDLAASIRAVGVIEPLVVAKRELGYEVVAGHRRLIASRMAQLVKVPCVVHDTFRDAEEAVMLHENIHREDLSPVDEARFFARLLDQCGGNTERVAELVRERRDRVESRLALLGGDADVLQALERGAVSIGVAQELNQYEHPPTRRAHLDLAIRGGASVGMVREWRKEANHFHHLQQTRVEPAAPAAVNEPLPEPVNPYVCYFCGSAEHVEAMEMVYIHKPCKGLLRQALGDRFRE